MTLNPQQQVEDALEAGGLLLHGRDQFAWDAKTYCHASRDAVGKGPKASAGCYLASLVTPETGEPFAVGWWRNYWNDTWGVIKPDRNLDAAERAEADKQQKAAAKVRAQEVRERAAEAAARAKDLWKRAGEQGSTPYLQRKGIGLHGARVLRDSVVVPVFTLERDLVGLQWIDAEGGKKFLRGTAKQGALAMVGRVDPEADDPLVCFAEGYATAVSIFQATSYPVVICFDAGNLAEVVKLWRQAHPHQRMLVCCDDDHETEGNPGKSKGMEAAKAARAAWCWPQFKQPEGRTDFNDMHAELGLAAVRKLVKASANRAIGGRWRNELTHSKRSDGYKCNQHNVALVLENDHQWTRLLRLDAFANRIVMTREPPFGGLQREVTDAELSEIAAWFGKPWPYNMSVSASLAAETVSMVATRHAFHPVREYLEGLEWDGKERISRVLIDYFGAGDGEYEQGVSRLFMLSAVARVIHPGCKVDTMVVLEGAQGLGKSSGVRELVGADWFMDTSQPFGDKDFYQSIAGKWVIELAEIAALSKPDVNKVKAGLSAQKDTYRPSYGRVARDYPRQCVFVGTTNESDWMRDHTGGRRFLPIRAGNVDVPAIGEDRDQLWAEALVAYRDALAAREPWWQVPALAAEEQDARFQDDPWAIPIAMWLAGRRPPKDYPEDGKSLTIETCKDLPGNVIAQCAVADILEHALGIETGRQTPQESQRAGRVMTRLEWGQKRLRMADGTRPRVWFRPDDAEPPEAPPPITDVEGVDAF